MATESIQDIKRRIKSVSSTERITNSMRLVSAGKLRKAKRVFEETSENSYFITHTIGELFVSGQDVPQEYLEGNREIRRTAYIIVTSSKGLCGGFNTNVIKESQNLMKKDSEKPVMVAVGNKGKEYFEKNGYDIHSTYMLPPETITFLEAGELAAPLLEMYRNREIDQIVLVYTSFVNSMEQKPVAERLLPFSAESAVDEETDKEEKKILKQIAYDPSVDEVFNYLIPKFVEMKLYSSIIESAACEHAARRMAMENATDNAREMLDTLNLNYNRARQSAITDEIIEIVAGSEAQN